MGATAACLKINRRAREQEKDRSKVFGPGWRVDLNDLMLLLPSGSPDLLLILDAAVAELSPDRE
jgi:hypothetical protein